MIPNAIYLLLIVILGFLVGVIVNLLADYGGPELTPCDHHRLVMAGVRACPHDPEIDATMAQLGDRPLSLAAEANTEGLGLSDDELKVEKMLRERPRTAAELLAAEGVKEGVVRITLYALVVAQALSFADGAGSD